MPKIVPLLHRVFALRCISLVCGLTVAASASAAQTLSHAPDPLFHDGLEGVTAGPFSDSDASRFLAQATFGPSDTDMAHLKSVGYVGWLNEQFAATPTYEITDQPGQVAYLNWIQNTLQEDVGQNNRQEAWFQGALGGPDPQNNLVVHNDQLRQRVAFALSEILVTSDQNTTLSGFPKGLAYYYDILVKDAFGNYRQLLEDVTLSPAMGVYLNMMGNRRADLSQNLHPDENYAREINQLFSIGLVMLNIDGTPQLSGGNTIPTYTQSTITNFAHVFTGWNWADCDSNGYDNFIYCGPDYQASANFLTPMVAYDKADFPRTGDPSYHDNGTDPVNDVPNKQLLIYPGVASNGVVPNNGTAASDLKFALDNIYNHPNVAPFISKQLIQRLVTSNPSPAYVQRVATVFNANRSSATQLRQVVQAILLDPEARYGQWQSPDTFGKLREPLLTVTHYWRAMHAVHACGQNVDQNNSDGTVTHYRYANQPYRYGGNGTAWYTNGTQYGGVAQASLDAFTVFNFFKPSFKPAGEMTTRGLYGPEFQLQTDSIAANSNNTLLYWTLYNAYDVNNACDGTGDDDQQFGDIKIDHAQDVALAGSGQGGAGDPSDRLVDEYNKRFMSGQMSPYMRNQLVSYLNTIDSSWAYPQGSDWRLQRVRRALFLILTSPEYMIQK
ncbi:MAG TPA: DUF1800 family protein [Rudaea sp.]|nr:DUF1800 family protein [Rudaea sp.]